MTISALPVPNIALAPDVAARNDAMAASWKPQSPEHLSVQARSLSHYLFTIFLERIG